RGERPAFPLLVLHGGPGLDHTEFSGYLDPLTEGGSYRLVLADARAGGRSDRTALRGTWTRGRMAQGVSDLAARLGVRGGYATLGHSSGAFVVVQQLAALEPAGLRPQVRLSWARGRQGRAPGPAAPVLGGPPAVYLPGPPPGPAARRPAPPPPRRP